MAAMRGAPVSSPSSTISGIDRNGSITPAGIDCTASTPSPSVRICGDSRVVPAMPSPGAPGLVRLRRPVARSKYTIWPG